MHTINADTKQYKKTSHAVQLSRLDRNLLSRLFKLELMKSDMEQLYPDQIDEYSSKHQLKYYNLVREEYSDIAREIAKHIKESVLLINEFRTQGKCFQYFKAIYYIEQQIERLLDLGMDFSKRFWAMPHAAANSDTKGWICDRLNNGRYVPETVFPEWDRNLLPPFDWNTLGQ